MYICVYMYISCLLIYLCCRLKQFNFLKEINMYTNRSQSVK